MSGLFLGASTAWAASFNILGTYDFGGVNSEIDVDPVNDFVYLSSGMGGHGITRFDVSNPASISSATVSTSWGGGIGVNPTTGNYASTDGRLMNSQFGVFNPLNPIPFDTESLTG